MIITRTPFRISFFGGGTDYPLWFQEHGGQVLATTIDKYCYINCRYLPPFFEHKHRIVYSKIENVKKIEEIDHPAIKGVLSWMEWEKGLEIHHDGDLPARSGLGSSSSFTVGLINTLYALRGERISKKDLSRKAIYVEQEVIKEHVGSQDQISAAYGGFNRIAFHQNGDFTVEPVVINHNRLEELQNHLMLFFTGISRNAPEIAKSKMDNFKDRVMELKTMDGMVTEGQSILLSPYTPIGEFGKLLHESWMLKRKLSDKVSNATVDQVYETARKNGAIGGKILGAGGGGFFLLFAPPGFQPKIREALKDLVYVPIRFETGGSQVVLYQPDGLA
uniref:Kinase n=1 Tax=Leptospirillum ferriphilum TaxID=178606 RepID=A0A7C3LUM9_9BACT